MSFFAELPVQEDTLIRLVLIQMVRKLVSPYDALDIIERLLMRALALYLSMEGRVNPIEVKDQVLIRAILKMAIYYPPGLDADEAVAKYGDFVFNVWFWRVSCCFTHYK